MIECRNISIDAGKRRILENITFTAETGRITVLLGKNGCGKTTLLRAIDGAIHYNGSMIVDGSENSALSTAARSKHISFMPQMLHCPAITVRELVSFGRQPYTNIAGILSPRDHQIVENILQKTGLDTLAGKRLDCISGGERQKAYFALLLSQDTPNLLLDEPATHLDASYSKQLMNFLREEKRDGKTILAVLHDINSALEIADKIVVLQSGRIAFEGNPNAFYAATVAESIFGLKKYLCTDSDHPAGNRFCYL